MKGKTNASSDGFQRQILINGNSDSPIYGSDPPSFQAKEGQIYYQIQDGGSSESGDFNKLINRPQYNGQPMTNATNIPEVKTSIWDSKQDQITDIANIRTGAGLGMTAIQPSGYNPTAKTDQMTQAVGKDDNGKLWTTPGGGGGTGNFNDLTNRPSYNGIAMTNATNIPFVDSTNWNNAYSWVNSNGPSVKSHTTNTDIHVTSSQKTAWDGKYSKPSTGIPKSDLADDAVIGLVVSAIVNADTGRITSYSPDYETIASAVTNKKAVVARVIYEEGCIDYCLSCASADSDSLLFTYAGYISDEFTIDIKSFRIYNDDDPSSCNIEIKESHSPAKGFFSANRILATDSSGEFTDRVVDSSPTSGHSNYLISSGGVYTALSNKQDSLPNPTKDYYLHSNATNGALEWKAVNYNPNTSTAAMTQTVGVDGNGKLWTIPGGTTNFDALTNRPSYNGIVMTSSTKIPSVDSKNWTAAYSWVNSNGNSVVNHIANTSVHVNSTEKTTWNNKINITDIQTNISPLSTDLQVPSAKCVYDQLTNKSVFTVKFSYNYSTHTRTADKTFNEVYTRVANGESVVGYDEYDMAFYPNVIYLSDGMFDSAIAFYFSEVAYHPLDDMAFTTRVLILSKDETVTKNDRYVNVENYLHKQQGTASAGQFLVVGSDGNVTTQPITFWDGSVEVIS